MKVKLNEINEETGNITNSLETLDGQMSFFSELIVDMENHPEGSALMVKHGKVQRKLFAIYTLFNNQLQQIREGNKNIEELSDQENEVKIV